MAAYGTQSEVDINVYGKKKGAMIIDLRSDTVTKPSRAMRQAMFDAIVGDDVYGEDPTVNELERKAADMVGKEDALFVTSGTMGNLIAIMVHCNERGCEAYCGEESHTILHEQGGAAQIAGVTMCPIPNDVDGSFDLTLLKTKFRKDRLHEPTSRLVIVENPFNGRIVEQDWQEKLFKLAKRQNLKLHMDGARLWNAVVELNVSAQSIVENFDSVTFCLSKGLGAPVGSLLCGSRSFISQARRIRKVLGGGMRQSGVLAAAGIVALDETIPMLKRDHERAREMAIAIKKVISEIDADCYCSISTNMVFLNIPPSRSDAKSFVKKLQDVEDDPPDRKVIVQALALTDSKTRFVFHRDINNYMLDAAIRKITKVLTEIFS